MKTEDVIKWLTEHAAGMRLGLTAYWCPTCKGEVTPESNECCGDCGTFVGGEPDSTVPDMLDAALFHLRELHEQDEAVRRMVHAFRGHADDRDSATSLEVAGRLGELSAAESDCEELRAEIERLTRERDEARAAAKALGAALAAAQPMDPMEVVASDDDAVWRVMAEACDCPTQCVECCEPLTTQFDFQRQQCAECWELINSEAAQ